MATKKRSTTRKKRSNSTNRNLKTKVTIDGFAVPQKKTSSKSTAKHSTKSSSKSQKTINDIKAEISRLESINQQETEKSQKQALAEDVLDEKIEPIADEDEFIDENEQIIDEDEPIGKEPSEEDEKPKKSHGSASKITRIVLVALEGITVVIFLVTVFRFGALPLWQSLIVTAIVALLFAFTARKLIKRRAKKATRIICALLALLLIVIYCAGTYYIGQLMSFVQNITSSNTEKQNYSVAVLKDAGYQKISDLGNKNIGFQSNNLYLEKVKAELSNAVTYEAKDYTDLADMFIDLQSNEAAAITLATSNIEILKEDAEEYYNQIRIIYTFDIEIEKEEETQSDKDLSSEPFIVYISGTDSRGTVADAARSDVNMLAVVNPEKGKILLVSVPRDYYVQLHGTTGLKDKLTHAGIYGINMSKNTMADLFDVEIDHTIKVSFSTVEKLVDAVDGIDIYSDASFQAWTDKTCHIQKGDIHLDGRCALAFARERYAYASGDRHRIQNQQNVLEAVFKKATQIKYLANYPSLLSAIEGTFQTSFTYDQITDFAKMQLNTLRSWEIESISVDGTGSMSPTYSMGSQPLYVMIPDQTTVDTAKAKINEYLEQ